MIKYLLVVFSLFFTCRYSIAQEVIGSGQPGQSIGFIILGQNYFQHQSNLNFDKSQTNENIQATSVFRYGVHENLELSSVLAYQNQFEPSDEKINIWALGFRYRLNQSDSYLPLVFQLRVGENEGNIFTQSVLSSGASLLSNSTLNFNLIFLGRNEGDDELSYTLSYTYQVNEALSVFVENYGSQVDEDFSTFFDTGFAYLLSDDYQLDASIGGGNTRSQNSYFINIGFSGRFKI